MPSQPPHFSHRPKAASLALILLVMAFLSALSGVAHSQDAVSDKLENEAAKYGQWHIQADKISAQHDKEVLEAEGNVLLTQDDNFLKADYARYYKTTGWVYLRGNVEAEWARDTLKAEEAEFDLKNKVGWLKNGEIYVAEPHLFFRGEHIEKHEGDHYTFKNATVTACDESPESWSLDLEEGEITLEGYAWLWNPWFKIRGQSAMYSPLLVLPVKEKRQSGLLVPDTGQSSRLGWHVNLPLYWAISDEADATFYQNYMTDRGYMQGVEFRHTPDAETKGLWRFDVMHDQVKNAEELDEDEQFQGDGLVRANRTRYWWRSKFDGHLPDPEWKIKLDVDWVSDQNYLREFKNGQSGFSASQEMFLKEYNRDIAAADALERESALLITRSWDRVGVAGRVGWTQNLAYQGGNHDRGRNPTVQRLPELHAYVYKDHLLSSPLEWELNMGATNFWREYGTKGSRFEADPSVSLPMQVGPVSIIPTAGFRETVYAVSEYENRTDPHTDGKTTARHLPHFNVEAFTEVFKVYDTGGQQELVKDKAFVGNSRWTKIKHSIQPRVEYDLTPYVSQSNKPFFDELDRISAQNEITYSLTNVLDRRRDTVSLSGPQDDEQAVFTADYLEFFRLRLEQSFDMREATRNDERDTYARRPFSDAMAQLTISPEKWLSLYSKSYFSPYKGEVTEHEHGIRATWEGVGWAETALDFQESIDEYKRKARERIRQVRYAVELNLSRRWSTGFVYRADLVTDTDLEKSIHAKYTHQCWSVTFAFIRTPFEDRYEARVELVGFSL